MPTDTVDLMVPQRHASVQFPLDPFGDSRQTSGQYLDVAINLRGVTTVVLPGTGSDDYYIARAFAGPLRDAGARIAAHPPQPAHLIEGYLAGLDEAARSGPIAVGGVSIGAAVAAAWALQHPDSTMAVLAALPAWTGAPGSAPAAVAARHSAHQLRHLGLAATTTRMRMSSPPWLAEELTRSWRGQWPYLPDAMEEAAAYSAPARAQLEQLTAPMGIAAAADDPVHPLEIGLEWAAAAPHAALRTVTLDQIGADPAVLGAACLAALRTVQQRTSVDR
jgi:pimeloyl-ACP methyl ester carboxylesterase